MADKLYHRANPRSSFRPCALGCGDTALLFAITPHPQQSRYYGPKALLCTRMTFLHTTRDPEIN